MKASELNYPVVCLAADGTVFSVPHASRLTTCSRTALKNGFYTNLDVVDSSGQAHRVRRVESQPATIWQHLGLSSLSVDIDLERTGPVSLDELKVQVLTAMSKFPEPWDSAVGRDLSEWQQQVQAQAKIEDLIRLLALE